MLELATNYSENPVMVKDIARKQNISNRYLEQLLLLLKIAGFVKASRGTHGGFILARPPEQIRLGEIVNALEGPITLVDCVDIPAHYPKSSCCAMHDIWLQVGEAMNKILDSITLQDLVQLQAQKVKQLQQEIVGTKSHS